VIYSQEIASAKSEHGLLAEKHDWSFSISLYSGLSRGNIDRMEQNSMRKSSVLSFHRSRTLRLTEDIEISEQDDDKSYQCIVRFPYNMEDTRPRQTEIGRRGKYAIVAALYPFWQWRRVQKSQSVGHERALSLESRNALRNNVTASERNVGRAPELGTVLFSLPANDSSRIDSHGSSWNEITIIIDDYNRPIPMELIRKPERCLHNVYVLKRKIFF
jgi:hypothetical protein